MDDIFSAYEQHYDAGKHVTYFLLCPSFSFMTKKWEDLAILFMKDFLHFDKNYGKNKNNLRHASLHIEFLYIS